MRLPKAFKPTTAFRIDGVGDGWRAGDWWFNYELAPFANPLTTEQTGWSGTVREYSECSEMIDGAEARIVAFRARDLYLAGAHWSSMPTNNRLTLFSSGATRSQQLAALRALRTVRFKR